MKSISERPPILTVHEDSGDYILRVGDTKWRSLIVGVSKLLPDAKRLIVVTPGDVKFFVMGGGDEADRGDFSDGSGDAGSGDSVVRSDVEAEQESHAVPNADLDAVAPSGGEIVGETPQGTKVVRRKSRSRSETPGHDENCQRCGGTGKAKVLMEGGGGGGDDVPDLQWSRDDTTVWN